MSADERNYLRGRRQTTCGQEVLLQLPREGVLMHGDLLSDAKSHTIVLVKAAIEDLLVIRSTSILELTRASYHLGNRHVNLELHSNEIYLLEDPVLENLLLIRGLEVEKVKKPFFPELGAYSQLGHKS